MVWHAILHTHHGNTHIIAVGRGRRGEGGGEGGEEEEEEKHADIKSNNPHLTGGEKTLKTPERPEKRALNWLFRGFVGDEKLHSYMIYGDYKKNILRIPINHPI